MVRPETVVVPFVLIACAPFSVPPAKLALPVRVSAVPGPPVSVATAPSLKEPA